MGSPNAVRGWLGICLVVILAPIMALAVYPGWKTVLVLVFLGLLALAAAVTVVRHRGMESLAAIGRSADLLFQSFSDGEEGSAKTKKVPRPTSYWKGQLIEAAGGQCEIQACRKVAHLEVHHIYEHARGGGNALHNLLVLCPNHHKLAGSGGINKTRQKTLAKRSNRFGDASFAGKWSKNVLRKERQRDEEPDFGISF